MRGILPPNRISGKPHVIVLESREGPIPATAAPLEPSNRYAPMGSILGRVAAHRAGAGAIVPRLRGIRRPPRCGPARRRLVSPHTRHHACASAGRRHGDRARLRRELPGSGPDRCNRVVHHNGAGNGVGAAALRASGLHRSRSRVRAPGAPSGSTRERRPDGPGSEVARGSRGHDPALHAVGRRRDLHQARRRNPRAAGSRRLGKHLGRLGHRPPRLESVPSD